MKFKHGTRRRAIEYEKDWIARWKADKTFEKSVENRPKDNAYVFYDGPPFITGVPHHGTLLSSIVKDAVPRYWTMKGKRVERVWGWDCHGLPAENFVEKQLNITDRRQIVTHPDEPKPLDKEGNELPTITLEEYVTKARESMVANSATWEDVIDRVGRWVDFKGAYRTMDKDFMESVWWAFKELYEKGKIYQGEKVLMYDTRFATPVSKAEVTMDNDAYQTVTDPSVYVKFKLEESSDSAQDKKPHVVILHGFHGEADKNWLPWLKAELENRGHTVEVPNLPDTHEPNEKDQVQHVLDTCHFDENTVLIGHSLGGAVAMKVLEALPHAIRDLVLVAPVMEKEFYTPENSLTPDGKKRTFLDTFSLTVDHDVMVKKSGRQTVLQADNDDPSRAPYLEHLAQALGTTVRATQSEKDHFTGEKEPFILAQLEELFEKDSGEARYLLAWTTTPWTLPANTAVAVGADIKYVEVLVEGERLILAKDRLEAVMKDERNQPLEYTIEREFRGSELVGKSYQPLFAHQGENAHKVWVADYVSTENGSGLVHLAPIYGEEDFELAGENNIPRVHVLDDNGFYYPEVAEELFKLMPWVDDTKPLEVWDNNKNLAKGMKKAGMAWKVEYVEHEYPFNPRSKQRIMYRAIPSWFFDVQGSKPLMLEKNDNINWFPEHLKHGRFAKNIDQAPDWNLSRDRFWATAMPVWEGDKGTIKVIGSYAELKELSGVELEDYHRPWVDEVTFEIDGEKFVRVDKVLDGWFESGSMPFAQFHYPFENKEKFEQNFPGDFIVEYIGQVRAWFYYVHVIGTALFGAEAYKNVITTGTLAGNDGRKMSKSLGNFTDPNELMDNYSADSLRFLLLSSPVLSGEDFNLLDKDVGDVARKLGMIWNMYDFFTMYAEVDGWEYKGSFVDPLVGSTDESAVSNPLDIWIVSRVHQLVAEVEEHMDEYNLPAAMAPIMPFIDDASNWYVRRSRRRFWKSEDDGDKDDAYRTLHYVLLRLAYVLAPFAPFLAEELHHNLTGDEESIHLKDWWSVGEVNEEVISDMANLREYVNEGLSQRAQAGLKVRQPLAGIAVPYLGSAVDFTPILLEELNVKMVTYGEDVQIDEELTPELKREGMMREVIRHVQSARKKAGLHVNDRIHLKLEAEDDEVAQAISEHYHEIYHETLAVDDQASGEAVEVKVDKTDLTIMLNKADV